MQRVLWSMVLGSIVGGCATAPKVGKGLPAEELLMRACEPGKNVRSVNGTVWLKTQSPELNGQFSANVLATSPAELKMEFTNILGGAEAIISVQGNHYWVTSADQKKEKKDEGYGSWGGIPLRWATDLFLGKIPCPALPSSEATLDVSDEGELSVLIPKKATQEPQKYSYRFIKRNGKPWPTSMRWEQMGESKISVDFKFDDPDEKTLSPRKWEARSSHGAIKVKWTDHDATVQESTKLK